MGELYGYIRNEDPHELRQTWVPTYDPEAMLRPSSEFVAGDSFEDIFAALRRRFPVPESVSSALSRYAPQRVYENIHAAGSGGMTPGVVVTKYPTVKVEYNRNTFAEQAVAAVAECGGLIINPADRATVYGPSKHIAKIRESSAFRESELVIREVQVGHSAWSVMVRSPAQAKRRQSFGKKKKVASEEQRKKNEADYALHKLYQDRIGDPADKAAVDLWMDCPLLVRISGKNAWDVNQVKFIGCTSRRHLVCFFHVVAIHEELRGKGRWRELPAVRKFLKEGLNPKVVALFGNKVVEDNEPGHHTPADVVERFCREARRAKLSAALRAARAAKVAVT